MRSETYLLLPKPKLSFKYCQKWETATRWCQDNSSHCVQKMSLSSIMVPAILHEEMPVGVAPWAGKGPISIPGAVSSVPSCLVPLSLGQRLGKVLGWREHKMISFNFMGKGRGKASALLPMPCLQTQLQGWWLSPAGGHAGVPRSGCLCCGLAAAWCAFVLSAWLGCGPWSQCQGVRKH